MSRTKNVNIYVAKLLNGKKVMVKNGNGKKIDRLLDKQYIKDYEMYAVCERKDLTCVRVDYDLDNIRSLKDMHTTFVRDIYLKPVNVNKQ